MAVILETSLGDITIDLLTDYAPKCCENFLKLCKIKYYNYAPIHTVNKDLFLQTGDPIGPGSKDSDGGSSIWGLLDGPSRKTFKPEMNKRLKHNERGTVSMATVPSAHDPDEREAGSQFIITLGDNMEERFDGKAAIFGRVAEGFDVLEERINPAFVDGDGRPLKDIRILHTIVLDEADIPDPAGLVEPPGSPVPTDAQLATVRIAHDETLQEETDPAELERVRRRREAEAQALTLEMVGDLPFAGVAPPENVLFVCKLNPVTQDEDLQLIFSRFGRILSCEIIRDKRTGDSLQYAFVEFAERASCEQAYFKMQDVLIDDHRIHVDFSQSVSRLADVWRTGEQQKRKGGRGGGGGFGGVAELEKRTQYRNERDREAADDGYGMVFDKRRRGQAREERSGERRRERSRSPRGKPRDEKQHHQGRRERSRDRYRDERRDRDKHRDYDRDRHHGRGRWRSR